MEKRSYNKQPRSFRTTFKLVGDVVKITEQSILVQKAEANNQFWLEKSKYFNNDIETGRRYSFDITVSTYLSKEDSEIRTKLRTHKTQSFSGDIHDESETFIGNLTGVIEDYIRTDIGSLWILELHTQSNEIYYLRYFSADEPITGKCSLLLNLRSTSKIIDKEGHVWDAFRKYTDKVGIEQETKRWMPSLEVVEIKSES